MYAIDAQTGEEKWRFWTEEFVFSGISSSATVANKTVYVGGED